MRSTRWLLQWLSFILPSLSDDLFYVFRTEPEIFSPRLNVTTYPTDPSNLSDGFLFTSLYLYGRDTSYGPQIYSKTGELVWNGVGVATESFPVHNFRTCNFNGSSHLCWTELHAPGRNDRRAGHYVLDKTYAEAVEHFGATGGLDIPDGHEFNMLKDGNYLQVVYQDKEMDLTPYGGLQGGTAADGCFQDINAITREAIFTFCMSDHFPVWNTNMYLDIESNTNFSETGGGNGDKEYPWDPWHINSVDKNVDGDYLISLRNLNQLVKIAGNNSPSGRRPGEVFWRLNGKQTTIDMGDPRFEFYTQHHARYISSNGTGDIISLFNNAYQLSTSRASVPSSGMILQVNNITSKAKLQQNYTNPRGDMSSCQGSFQVLPNGNKLAGWGCVNGLTEFADDGTVLLDATFNSNSHIISYRTYAEPWLGKPQWPPKLLAYSLSCHPKNLVVYVSWNGATEVNAWRLYLHFTSIRSEPWIPAGTYKRTGFETRIEVSVSKWLSRAGFGFIHAVRVDAISHAGAVLSSTETRTWVPSDAVVHSGRCDAFGCNEPERFVYNHTLSSAELCKTSRGIATVSFIFTSVVAFVLFVLGRKVLRRRVSSHNKLQHIELQDRYRDTPS